ncbi:MAG TPA: DUF2490 domain-containing protein [Chryseolinea sp.]|nr:DUF2490 domain-containing protein [Chryseolinea sp.]
MTFNRCWLLLAVVLSSHSLLAQTKYHHNVFWGRIILADNITDRLRTELWIQKRTQDTEPGSSMFDADQFDSYWLWFTYSINKNFKVSLSPFGYFESYFLYTNPADLDRAPVKEFRYTLRLEQEQKYKWINYGNRYSFEYRTRDLSNSGNYKPNWRFRYMARFEKPIRGDWLNEKALSVIAYDEIMLQFGKAVMGNPNVFDQNRIYLGISYQLFENIKITPGYLFTIQQRPSGEEFDYINTYWIVLTFDNLVSQFVKRD